MASSNVSVFKSEVFRNKYVWFALCLSGFIIYLAFLIKPFGKTINIHSLELKDALVISISAVVSLIIIQILKRTKILKDESK
jgi:Ca2+-transporting ATPase